MFLVFGDGVLHGFNIVLISFFEGLTALSLGCTQDSRFEGCRLSKGLGFKLVARVWSFFDKPQVGVLWD